VTDPLKEARGGPLSQAQERTCQSLRGIFSYGKPHKTLDKPMKKDSQVAHQLQMLATKADKMPKAGSCPL
jgi:hypothetical protein